MSIEEIKQKLRSQKKELKGKYKIKEIGVFGSYVKGNQKEKSDLDILVEFEKNAKLSLLDVAGLEIELSELLGVKVDLVEKQTLKPYIGKHILQEVIREKTREKTRKKILRLIKENKEITTAELSAKIGISEKGIEWQISKLKKGGVLKRIGGRKGGYWEVTEK